MHNQLTPLRAAERIARAKPSADLERAAQWLIGALADPGFGIRATCERREHWACLATCDVVFSEVWEHDIIPSDYWRPGHAALASADTGFTLGDVASFEHSRFSSTENRTAFDTWRRFPAYADALHHLGMEAIELKHDVCGAAISITDVDRIIARDARALDRKWRNLNDRRSGPLEPTRAPSRAVIDLAAELCVKLYCEAGRLSEARDRPQLVRLLKSLDGSSAGASERQIAIFASAVSDLANLVSKPVSE